MQTSRRATQIVKIQKRRQELAAKTRDADRLLADRLRRLQTDETKSERKRETRRKIIIGAIVRAAQTSRTDISLRWLEEQIRALKRPDDRALFGLDVEPSADAADADRAETAAARSAPITARQKKLLAKLVEEHPRLAREFGVDPEEPGLEKLGKAKAASLIPTDARPRQRAGAARCTMTTRAPGRRAAADCRPAGVRREGSSVSSRWWEVSERAGRRGRRSSGGRRHARAGSVTAPSSPGSLAGRSTLRQALRIRCGAPPIAGTATAPTASRPRPAAGDPACRSAGPNRA